MTGDRVRGAIQIIGGRLPPGTREAAIIGDVIARVALHLVATDVPPPRLQNARALWWVTEIR